MIFNSEVKKISIRGIDISSDELLCVIEELGIIPLFLRRLIERIDSDDIKPSDQEQYDNLQLFMKKERIGSPEELEHWLDKNHIDEKSLSLKLYRLLQIEIFKEIKFGPQVENIFLSKKEDLDKVMYSIFRSKKKAKAVEIHLKIEEQESTFADLASEFSEGIEQQINGLIGPIEIGKINIEIAERLKISQKGQLWEPFQVDDWWVLLRLEKMLPSKLDQAMRKKIINELYNEWIKKEVDIAIAKLKADCKSQHTITKTENAESTSFAENTDNKEETKNKSRLLPDSSRLKSIIRGLPFGRG